MSTAGIPPELLEQIKLDIINREYGVESVAILANAIEVTVSQKYPLPTAREVVVGTRRIPIIYKRGSVYSLGSRQFLSYMMETRAQQAEAAADNLSCRTCTFETIMGGISIGHYLITAGTLACFVYRREDSRWAILTNNHVGANMNNASKGDSWLQPGNADRTGEPRVVARLERFVPFKFLQNYETPVTPLNVNKVDCSIGMPLESISKTRSIIEIGFPMGTRSALIGQTCRKSGRTSGTNVGKVKSVNSTIQGNFGTETKPLYVAFTDLIETDPIVRPGDSGSLLLDSEGFAIGLIFAAAWVQNSDGSKTWTAGYACKIQNVLDALNCTMLRQQSASSDPVGAMLPRIAAGLLTGGTGGGIA